MLIQPTLPRSSPQVTFLGESTGKHCSGQLQILVSQYIHKVGRRTD